MKIFEENGKIRLQLKNMINNTMLFDFTVEKGEYNELRDHLISNLEDFNVKNIEQHLVELANNLEPKTHCCECTPGDYFQKHAVHIQYPDCTCHKGNYILTRNP